MISALAWIPKGAARLEPLYVEIGEDDEEAIKAMQDLEENETEEVEEMATSDEDEDELERAKNVAAMLKKSDKVKPISTDTEQQSKLADSLAELDMDRYDDEDDTDMQRILGGGNPGMAFYANPKDDPYLKKRVDGSDASDTESEDDRLRESDLLIMAARNEEDISHLDIWVYEEREEGNPDGNIYVHHTVMLPAFPLCLDWGCCDPLSGNTNGNFAAVGSFEPGIEIWNLDLLDAVEPIVTLGGADYEKAKQDDSLRNKKKKKNKPSDLPSIPVKPGSHRDAVLGLAWNPEFTNVLASGSADETVKIWDLVANQPTHTLTPHSGKVQSVRWRPVDASVLLSGGFDMNIFLSDMRNPESAPLQWQINADVEAISWDPHNPYNFAVSSEDGSVSIFDSRQGSSCQPLVKHQAHSKATTSISFCPSMKDTLITGSTDATAKLWKIDDGIFKEIACENMGVGSIFTLAYSRDSSMLVAAGGANGSVSVWDTKIQQRYDIRVSNVKA